MNKECEEGTQLRLDWHKLQSIAEADLAVIPAVAQDVETGAVVMIGYVNEEALREALSRKCAVFWSTSRNELWIKGGTSGNVLPLEEVRVNCEQNSILYRMRAREPVTPLMRTAARGSGAITAKSPHWSICSLPETAAKCQLLQRQGKIETTSGKIAGSKVTIVDPFVHFLHHLGIIDQGD